MDFGKNLRRIIVCAASNGGTFFVQNSPVQTPESNYKNYAIIYL